MSSMRVLVATDGSEPSHRTEQFVARLARAVPMEVLLTHVLNLEKLEYKMIPDFQVEMIREGAKRTAEGLLEREARSFRDLGLEVRPRLLVGDPGPSLCDFAHREGVSAAVVGRRGHGDLQDILFGSTSNYVVHHCRQPVMVVKRAGPILSADEAARPVRTLLALDPSGASQRCVDFLASLEEGRQGLDLTLIHVVNPDRFGLDHLPGEARYEALRSLHQAAEGLLALHAERLQGAGYAVRTRVEEGVTGKTLCRVYNEDRFELVVMGRRGMGDLNEMLFGSVTHFVVHHCSGHVLIVS